MTVAAGPIGQCARRIRSRDAREPSARRAAQRERRAIRDLTSRVHAGQLGGVRAAAICVTASGIPITDPACAAPFAAASATHHTDIHLAGDVRPSVDQAIRRSRHTRVCVTDLRLLTAGSAVAGLIAGLSSASFAPLLRPVVGVRCRVSAGVRVRPHEARHRHSDRAGARGARAWKRFIISNLAAVSTVLSGWVGLAGENRAMGAVGFSATVRIVTAPRWILPRVPGRSGTDRVRAMTTFLIQILLLAANVGAAILVGKYGQHKGYDFWLGFALAFVVTFIVGAIVVAVLRDRATGRRGVVTWR